MALPDTTQPELISPACPVCAAHGSRFWFTKNNCHLYRCADCKSIFIHPLSTDTAAIYSDGYFCGGDAGFGYAHYDEDFGVNNPTFHTYLALIEKHCREKGSLLDIGAATGTFISTAQKRGWNVMGVEISPYAAKKAQEKGLAMINGTVEESNFQGKLFDVVTMWDVLEHVRDPHKTIDAVSRVTKEGGLLAINLPDAGSMYARIMGKWWPLIVPPEHICLFHKDALATLLNAHHFTVIETTKVGKKFRPAYILQVMYTLRYQKIWKRMAHAVCKTPLNRLAIPLNLRDNLFVIARKQ